jgi:RimJ/RimL family protein N-acetyltransferase
MDTPVLDGHDVRLEPLEERHMAELETVAFEPSIWKYMIWTMKTRDDLRHWAEAAWEGQAADKIMPWVIVAKTKTGDVVAGGTRFMDLDLHNRSVEIGNTWITEEFRGTKVNTESKYLQLCYAFETLGLERVSFKAHAKNLRSQAAIKGIGGVYEGTFRHHMVMPDGSSRDSAWFSILKSEWPETKDTLKRRMNAPA